MKNAHGKSQSLSVKISPRYSLNTTEATDIYNNSKNALDMIHSAFKLGYLKGQSAAKKELQSTEVA